MYFKPYRYVKAPPEEKKDSKKAEPLLDEVFPFGLVFLGSLVLATQVIVPLISFPSEEPLLRPTEQASQGGDVLGRGSELLDGVKLEEEDRAEEKEEVPPVFFLSIPKLKIEKATVRTDTRDPDPIDFLGHFLGSALPGEPGAVLIYGHSTIPWFFDPSDYLTIFSTLPKLKQGDRINLFYKDYLWEYEVEGFKTLDPGEVDLSSFSADKPRLVLMTCVPPGTRLKRFFVLASLSRVIPLGGIEHAFGF